MFSLVYAVGFHTADEIMPGTFNGNFKFNGIFNISNNNYTLIFKEIPTTDKRLKFYNYLPADISNTAGLELGVNSDSNIRTAFYIKAGLNNISDLGRNSWVRFGVQDNGIYKDIIKFDGSNVGIGTMSPIAKLSVNGNITANAICDETGSNCQDLSNPSVGGNYALIDVNGGAAVGLNQRIVLTNPFGINTPVIVQAEIYRDSMWAASNFVLANGYGGVGVMASYVNGTGIVVQTGNYAISTNSNNEGTAFGATGNINSAPIRVHVWKLG